MKQCLFLEALNHSVKRVPNYIIYLVTLFFWTGQLNIHAELYKHFRRHSCMIAYCMKLETLICLLFV